MKKGNCWPEYVQRGQKMKFVIATENTKKTKKE